MRRRAFVGLVAIGLALPLGALAAACSSTAAIAPGADAGAEGGAAVDAGYAYTPIRLQMKVDVPPTKEIFRCQLVRLPKAESGDEIFIGGTSHEYTKGSHHYLVFRSNLTDIPAGQDVPFDCAENDAVMSHANNFAFGGQVPKDTRDLPPGIALPLKSEEVLILQVHYINASATTLAATVNIELRSVKKETVRERAGVFRMYDPYIYVPPKAQGATAQIRCPFKSDVTLLSAAPHMHARGVKHTVWLDPPGGAASEPLNVATDWEHPKGFEGPLAVKAGSSFRVQCAYDNPTDRTFLQGQSADLNEMCMWTAYYYPANEAGGEGCSVFADGVGAGKASCLDLSTCLQACPAGDTPRATPGLTGIDVGQCWQKCMVESCPNASAPLWGMYLCIQDKCKARCAGGGSDCQACAIEMCPTEVQTCSAATCPK